MSATTKIQLLLLLLCASNYSVYACGNHPGMTHEQWLSAIADERNKNGSIKSVSEGFFRPSVMAVDPPAADGERRRPNGGEGPIRIYQDIYQDN